MELIVVVVVIVIVVAILCWVGHVLVTCSRGFWIGIYDGQSRTAYLVAKLILKFWLQKQQYALCVGWGE